MRQQPVHIAEAIARGHAAVNRPTLWLAGVCAAVVLIGTTQFDLPELFPVIGFGSTILAVSVYRSIALTRWKLWAFTAVQDIYLLREKAVRAGLISDKALAGGLGLRTPAQTQQLRAIDNQLALPRPPVPFLDDTGVPEEIAIGFSPGQNYLQMLGSIGITAMGLYTVFAVDNYLFGTACAGIGLFGIWKEYREATDPRRHIVINRNGITTTSTGFTPWSRIENEGVILQEGRRKSRHYLTYRILPASPSLTTQPVVQEEKFQIDDFDTTPVELEHFLTIYRGRSERAAAHTENPG